MNKKNDKENEGLDGNQYVDYVKDHTQHAVEYGKNILSTAHTSVNEVTKKATDICATNLALFKSFLSCTSFDDMVHWGEKFVKTNVENCVETASSVYTKACSEVTEANSAITKKISKNITDLKKKF